MVEEGGSDNPDEVGEEMAKRIRRSASSSPVFAEVILIKVRKMPFIKQEKQSFI